MDSVPASLAVADFQQNGTYSAFVIASNGTSTARAFFASYSASTGWSNQSDALFRSSADWDACIRPEQSAVADLNGDGRPDIYVACSGDFGGSIQSVAQYVFLSQSNGKYIKVTASTSAGSTLLLHASGVALADINGDGCQDVVTTDNGSLLIITAMCSNGYTPSPNAYTLSLPSTNVGRLPSSLGSTPPNNVRSVFLIPRPVGNATRYDLLVAGGGNQGTPVIWYLNNPTLAKPAGSGFFDPQDVRNFRAYPLPYGDGNNRYDYIESGSSGYIYFRNASADSFVKLVRIPLPNPSSDITSLAYLDPTVIAPGDTAQWPSQLRVQNAELRVYDAGCPISVTLDNRSRCGRHYQLTGFAP
jgi:hypothetical protein